MIAWNRNGSTLHHHDVSVMPWPIETGSVQAVVTSPPYYCLRSYEGVEPAVWGGDPLCVHSWESVWTPNQNTGGGITFKQSTNPGSYQNGGPKPVKDDSPRGYENFFCPRCSAWRGTLGNENLHDCLAWAKGEQPCGGCYICRIRTILAELARVLRPDGTVWWNIGESMSGSGGSGGDHNVGGNRYNQPKYVGTKRSMQRYPDTRHAGAFVPPDKNLMGIPARTMLAAQADGWIIRSEIVWWKRNGLCSSAKDRPNNRHETVILMTRNPDYFFNESESGGSNVWGCPADVWDIPTEASTEKHYAGFPSALVRRCLAGGAYPGCLVLDPFTGRGMAGSEAIKAGCRFVGLEASPVYCEIGCRWLDNAVQQPALPLLSEGTEYRQAGLELFESEAVDG